MLDFYLKLKVIGWFVGMFLLASYLIVAFIRIVVILVDHLKK